MKNSGIFLNKTSKMIFIQINPGNNFPGRKILTSTLLNFVLLNLLYENSNDSLLCYNSIISPEYTAGPG
jgi:hypothetical protein